MISIGRRIICATRGHDEVQIIENKVEEGGLDDLVNFTGLVWTTRVVRRYCARCKEVLS